MHSALAIPEMQLEIAKYFDLQLPWKSTVYRFTTNPLDDRKTLSSLARTCSLLYDVLMPLVWRSIVDLRYLLRLIPQYHEPQGLNHGARFPGTFLDRPIKETDLQRFLFHSRFIQELAWDVSLGDSLSNDREFQALVDALPKTEPRYILPCLTSFYAYERGYKETLELSPVLAPLHSLRCLSYQLPAAIGMIAKFYGSQIFKPPPPGGHFQLTHLFLTSYRGLKIPPVRIFLHFSPSLTHLLLGDGVPFLECMAKDIEEAGQRLVAFRCGTFEPSALSKLLDVSAQSLQWLQIVGGHRASDCPFRTSVKVLPVLHSLLNTNWYNHNFFSDIRMPMLSGFSIYAEGLAGEGEPPPRFLPPLYHRMQHHPRCWDNVRWLKLCMNTALFKDDVKWGNETLSLFPNLEYLLWSCIASLLYFKDTGPPKHPKLRCLHIDNTVGIPFFHPPISSSVILKQRLPSLETLIFPEGTKTETIFPDPEELDFKVYIYRAPKTLETFEDFSLPNVFIL